MTFAPLKLSAGCAALLAIGACASPQTHFHTLQAFAPLETKSTTSGAVAVRLLGVRLPAAFDRLEVTEAQGGGQLRVDDLNRWGAPPNVLAAEALAKDLRLRAPGLLILPAVPPSASAARTLNVVFLSIDRRAGELAASVLVTVSGAPGDPNTGDRLFDLTVSQPDDGADGQVVALSRLLAALADRLEPILRDQPKA